MRICKSEHSVAEKVVNISSGPSGFRARTAKTSSCANDYGEAPLSLCVYLKYEHWRGKVERLGKVLVKSTRPFMFSIIHPCKSVMNLPESHTDTVVPQRSGITWIHIFSTSLSPFMVVVLDLM